MQPAAARDESDSLAATRGGVVRQGEQAGQGKIKRIFCIRASKQRAASSEQQAADSRQQAQVIMAARAAEHFYYLGEYRVAVCKECRHAVWPDQVQGHLQGRHHGIGGKDAEAIADEVRQFPGLIRFPGEFEVPAGVDRPIPELPVYADGLICKLQPDRCRYICRNEKAIKKYWRVEH